MSQRFRRSTDVLFETIDDESILLNLQDGYYYGLNPVGRAIWESLDRPKTMEELIIDLKQRFQDCGSDIQQDVQSFCQELLGPGLIEPSDV